MNRRNFIQLAAGSLFMPEPERLRAYSFLPGEYRKFPRSEVTYAIYERIRITRDNGLTYSWMWACIDSTTVKDLIKIGEPMFPQFADRYQYYR